MSDKSEGLGSVAASSLSGALAPMGCLMGAVMALFWLYLIGLALFIGWVIGLR
jgi:hypothetical protein